jgi:epsin
MGVLARRLQERDDNWRMCYKALLLLEHLLKHGPGKIVGDVQSSASVLDRLTHFEYKDANMRDHGARACRRGCRGEGRELLREPQRAAGTSRGSTATRKC